MLKTEKHYSPTGNIYGFFVWFMDRWRDSMLWSHHEGRERGKRRKRQEMKGMSEWRKKEWEKGGIGGKEEEERKGMSE